MQRLVGLLLAGGYYSNQAIRKVWAAALMADIQTSLRRLRVAVGRGAIAPFDILKINCLLYAGCEPVGVQL